MVSLIVDNDREWGNLADMLDALSTAADLAVFAEQHDEVDSMLRPLEASNVKPPYQQRLVTALAHVISSGLHLVCALEGSMLQPMPAAAVSCLCCCIDTYTALGSAIKKAGGIKGTKSSLQDVTDSGLLPAITAVGTLIKQAAPQHKLPTAITKPAAVKAAAGKPDRSTQMDQDSNPTAARSSPASSGAAAAGKLQIETVAAAELHTSCSPQSPASSGGAEQPSTANRPAPAAGPCPISMLCKGLLQLFAHVLCAIFPAPILQDKQLLDMLLAGAGIAVTALQLCKAAEGSTGPPATQIASVTSLGSVSQLSKGFLVPPGLLKTVDAAAQIVVTACYWELTDPSKPVTSAAARQLYLSDDVLQLLLWRLATAAESAYKAASSKAHSRTTSQAAAACQSGDDLSDMQHQQADAYHRQLFSALGFPAAGIATGTPDTVANCTMQLLMDSLAYRRGFGRLIQSAGPFLDPNPPLSLQQILKPSLTAPLFSTVIGLLTSLPTDSVLYMKCVALILFLENLLWVQSIQAATQAAAEAAAPAFASLVRPLVGGLLHMQLLMSSKSAAQLKPPPAVVCKCLSQSVARLLHFAAKAAPNDLMFQQVAELLSQQPAQTAATLEAAVRGAAATEESGLSELAQADVAQMLLNLLVHTSMTSSRLTQTCRNSPTAATAAGPATAADGQEPGLQLFALAISCLKSLKRAAVLGRSVSAAMTAAGASGVLLSGTDDFNIMQHFTVDESERRAAAIRVPGHVVKFDHRRKEVTAAVPATGIESSDQGSTSSSSSSRDEEFAAVANERTAVQPCGNIKSWLVLVSRSLFVEVKSLQQEIAAGKARVLDLEPAAHCLYAVAQWLNRRTADIGIQGNSAAVQQALQQLEKQQELQQRLMLYAGVAALKADEEGQLKQLLQDWLSTTAVSIHGLSAAVCAELTVQYCCANPECVDMSGSSELLMATKGFRCSSCKTVRYCGVGCQRQHWKQHKAICARYKSSSQK